MIPWVHLDTGTIPNGGGTLRLMRRGQEFSIQLGQNELMNSRLSGSEEALAERACERLAGRSAPRMLIGGLGMGFTLRAALAELGPDAEVVVAELVPAVAAWARGPLAHLFAGSLDDPRVALHETDVHHLIAASPGGYDAILLDVDNGPEGLVQRTNDRLYDVAGLGRAHRALRPGGLLGVWSESPDRKFKSRLQRGGFAVEEHKVRSAGSGGRHVVWIGEKTGAPPERSGAGTSGAGTSGTRISRRI